MITTSPFIYTKDIQPYPLDSYEARNISYARPIDEPLPIEIAQPVEVLQSDIPTPSSPLTLQKTPIEILKDVAVGALSGAAAVAGQIAGNELQNQNNQGNPITTTATSAFTKGFMQSDFITKYKTVLLFALGAIALYFITKKK